MAIRLEFISLIVPIQKIEQYYPGGFTRFVLERKSWFGGRLWHDDYLFRDGAMNPMDMQDLVEFWEDIGLTLIQERDGEKWWKDICVVDFFGGPTLPCDWLEVDLEEHAVQLKGMPRGQIVGREEMAALLYPRVNNSDRLAELFNGQKIRINRGALFDHILAPKAPSFDFGRVEGMLLGIAIGDALGVTTESLLPAKRRNRYGIVRDYIPNRLTQEARGFPSDDTQLSFWTLEQLIADKSFVPEFVAKKFSNSGKILGIGKTVKGFLKNIKTGVPWYESGPESAGNGALMRIAPILIPHLRTGGTDIWADTALAALMTHNDRSSTSACLAFVAMLWELLDMTNSPDPQWWVERYITLAKDLEGETVYSPRSERFRNYSGPLWRFVQEKLPIAYAQKHSVVDACNDWFSGAYLLETVPSVLYILMCHAHEPEVAVLRAVNDTKDNDTIAAIVGAAVGALHGKNGFPSRWIKNLTGRISNHDDGRVFDLIKEARQMFWDQS